MGLNSVILFIVIMIFIGIDAAKDKHDCFTISSDGEELYDVFTISKETLIKFALPKRFEIWYNNTIKAMVVQDNEARNIYRH